MTIFRSPVVLTDDDRPLSARSGTHQLLEGLRDAVTGNAGRILGPDGKPVQPGEGGLFNPRADVARAYRIGDTVTVRRPRIRYAELD